MANTSGYNLSLDERYAFIKQAGQGTYGTTWLAEDRTNGDMVAVKSISKNSTSLSRKSSNMASLSLPILTSSPPMTLPMRPTPPTSWYRTMQLEEIFLMQSNQMSAYRAQGQRIHLPDSRSCRLYAQQEPCSP